MLISVATIAEQLKMLDFAAFVPNANAVDESAIIGRATALSRILK